MDPTRSDLEPIGMHSDGDGARRRDARSRTARAGAFTSVAAVLLAVVACVIAAVAATDAREARRLVERTRLENEIRVGALESRTVRVPHIVGLNVIEASSLLSVGELEMTSNTPLDVPSTCLVVHQSPDPGTTVDPKSPVRVAIAPPADDTDSTRCD